MTQRVWIIMRHDPFDEDSRERIHSAHLSSDAANSEMARLSHAIEMKRMELIALRGEAALLLRELAVDGPRREEFRRMTENTSRQRVIEGELFRPGCQWPSRILILRVDDPEAPAIEEAPLTYPTNEEDRIWGAPPR